MAVATKRATRWNREHPDRRKDIARNYTYKSRFGITIEQYYEMFEAQGRKCAACGAEDVDGHTTRKFHLDHDHKTKKVRAILCFRCNRALGFANDSIERLQALIDYLRKHSP